MRVACRGYVAQPQALFTRVVLHGQNVAAVGRNRGQQRPAGRRDLADGEILKWRRPTAAEEGIDPISRRANQAKQDQNPRPSPPFVLASYCGNS